jgi:hypothetical protein
MPFSSHPTTTVFWYPSDDEENFNKNPNKKQWENIDISYQFNSQGFRTYDLPSLIGQKVDIALGCSLTLGIGLPVEVIWPTLIEKESKFPMLNLGQGGGSSDTVARILTNVCSLYDIQTVYILWPDASRFEIYNNDSNLKADPLVSFMHAQVADIKHMGHMNTEMSIQRFYKNQSIVHTLAKLYNFKVSEHFYAIGREFQKLLNISLSHLGLYHLADEDRARDGIHPGPKQHQLIARNFINEQ